jgi:dTDP-4-amino-4,6-dideoxygalactose transaminase
MDQAGAQKSAATTTHPFNVPQEPTFSLRYIGRHRPLLSSPTGSRRYALFMARNAIFHAVRMLGISPGQTILVPAYVCKAAVTPMLAAGANVEFYAVTRHCEVDFEDLAGRITADTAAVLAIHYFGFPTTIDRIRALCDDRRIALIEDCAHVLFDRLHGRPLGTFGDVSMFSWRKFLPVYDGSTLQINNLDHARDLELVKAPMEVVARSANRVLTGAFFFDEAANLVKRLLGREVAATVTGDECQVAPPVDPFETPTEQFNMPNAGVAMTWPSRLVLEHTNLLAIAAARRANFKALSRRLEATSGVTPLHTSPPPEGAPWVFPLIFEGHRDAHKTIRKHGVPAVAWDAVRPPQLSDTWSDADFLYHHLVFLPVHQGLDTSHLERIARAVEVTASRWPGPP